MKQSFEPVINELAVKLREIPCSILTPAYEIVKKERMENGE